LSELGGGVDGGCLLVCLWVRVWMSSILPPPLSRLTWEEKKKIAVAEVE